MTPRHLGTEGGNRHVLKPPEMEALLPGRGLSYEGVRPARQQVPRSRWGPFRHGHIIYNQPSTGPR